MALEIDRPGTPAAMRAALRWEAWYMQPGDRCVLCFAGPLFVLFIACMATLFGVFILLITCTLAVVLHSLELGRAGGGHGLRMLSLLPVPRPLLWRERWWIRFQQVLLSLLAVDLTATVFYFCLPEVAGVPLALFARELLMVTLALVFVFHATQGWGLPVSTRRFGMVSFGRWLGYVALLATVVTTLTDMHDPDTVVLVLDNGTARFGRAFGWVPLAPLWMTVPICVGLVLGSVAEYARTESAFVRGLSRQDDRLAEGPLPARKSILMAALLAEAVRTFVMGSGRSPTRAMVWNHLLTGAPWFALVALTWCGLSVFLVASAYVDPNVFFRAHDLRSLLTSLALCWLAVACCSVPPGSVGFHLLWSSEEGQCEHFDDRYLIPLFGSRKRWLFGWFAAHLICIGISLVLAAIAFALTGVLAYVVWGLSPLLSWASSLIALLVILVCGLCVPIVAPCAAIVHARLDRRKGDIEQGLTLAAISVAWAMVLIPSVVFIATALRSGAHATPAAVVGVLLVAGAAVFHVFYRLKASF